MTWQNCPNDFFAGLRVFATSAYPKSKNAEGKIRSNTAIFHGNPRATEIASTALERFRNWPRFQRTMLVCKSCPSCVRISFSHCELASDCSGTNRKDSTRDRLRRNRMDLRHIAQSPSKKTNIGSIACMRTGGGVAMPCVISPMRTNCAKPSEVHRENVRRMQLDRRAQML